MRNESKTPDTRRMVVGTSIDDSFAKVLIKDAGPRYGWENVSRLFYPFYTTKGEGLGMGLAISKEIIGSHRGAIWGENNPDKGATFFFTVPFDSASTGVQELPL